MKKVRVRYAPSPTGHLHIGNARTALFNYLFAKHYNGELIIRIEDTDTLRNVADGEKEQLKYLKWLGINWTEGPDVGGPHKPYNQLARLDLYKKYAEDLVKRGLAYYEYNKVDKKKYAIRVKSPKGEDYTFPDLIRGEISFKSDDVEDWIILKENGIPTYNFAVVIDDHLMEITHILRGEEHITNTPKQIMIYRYFNWEVPKFGHMTIIVNENNKKLSKRDKSIVQFISQYEEMGYLPDGILNFISLLGFSPKSNNEIMTHDEVVKAFDPKRLSKSPSMFDVKKLEFINKKHQDKLKPEELSKMVKRQLDKEKIKIPNKTWLLSLTRLFQNRMHYAGEIMPLYHEFFNEKYKLKQKDIKELKKFPDVQKLIKTFKNGLMKIDYTPENIKDLIMSTGKSLNIKGKNLFMPIRIATTGLSHGPSLEDNLYLLKKEEILKRLDGVISKLKK